MTNEQTFQLLIFAIVIAAVGFICYTIGSIGPAIGAM